MFPPPFAAKRQIEEFGAAIRLMPGENYQNLTFRSEIAGRKLAVGDAASSKKLVFVWKNA